MVPALQLLAVFGTSSEAASLAEEVAWATQATWHHVHFDLKSAPNHRDFRPERKESAK